MSNNTIINLGTTITQLNSYVDCSVVNIIYDQRRKLKFFNIPPPRFTPVSPYPQYTKEQLDMRRKIEILKYNRQNSKGNNLSKKQAYSLLAKNSINTNSYGNFTINQLQNNPSTTCNTDYTKSTWTTACDVPGKPMMLQYDPTIPLYNYINSATQDANYSTLPDSNTTMMHLYTQNELEYIYKTKEDLLPDSSNVNVVLGKNYQTRTMALGNIVNTKFMPNQLVSYSMNIPIGIWMIGFKDRGVIDEACDPSGIYLHDDPSYGLLEFQNSCYLKFPGNFTDTTTISGETLYPPIEFHIDYSIQLPTISIQYSGIDITPLSTPVYYSTLNPGVPQFFDVSFIPYNAQQQFYGIQYVGNLIIDNIVLPVQPEEVYDVSLTMSYYYDYAMFQEMDAFQTGLFFNLSQANINVFDGFEYSTKPPPYIDISYSATPVTNYPTLYQYFFAGSNIPFTSPVIKSAVISNVTANSVLIDKISGIYTYFNITRTQYDQNWNAVDTKLTIQNKGSSYTDNDLIPNTNYSFQITPVYNHMTGSINYVGYDGRITTSIVYVVANVQDLNVTYINFDNIHGTYSYYNLERRNTKTGEVVVVSNIISSSYKDINLNPGTTYKYTFTPFLLYTNGRAPYQGNPTIYTLKTYNCSILTANIGEVTSTSVTIENITGEFNYISIIRNGITSKVYLYQLPTNVFVDEDTRLISNATYTYVLIPSVKTTDGIVLDGKQTNLGSVTIP